MSKQAKNPKVSIKEFIGLQGVDKYNADSMIMKFKKSEDRTYNQWYTKLAGMYDLSDKKTVATDNKEPDNNNDNNDNND